MKRQRNETLPDKVLQKKIGLSGKEIVVTSTKEDSKEIDNNKSKLSNFLCCKNMSEIQSYLSIFASRVEIYKKWDTHLQDFLANRNFLAYNTAIQETTQSLRTLRENAQKIEFPDNLKIIISSIELLEDQHLKANVEYHTGKITGSSDSRNIVRKIEEEIMELVQELSNEEEL